MSFRERVLRRAEKVVQSTSWRPRRTKRKSPEQTPSGAPEPTSEGCCGRGRKILDPSRQPCCRDRTWSTVGTADARRIEDWVSCGYTVCLDEGRSQGGTVGPTHGGFRCLLPRHETLGCTRPNCSGEDRASRSQWIKCCWQVPDNRSRQF